MVAPIVAASLIGAGSSLLGNLMSQKSSDPGEKYMQQLRAMLADIPEPTEQDLQYAIQNMVYQGDLTPEQGNAIAQDPSLMLKVQANPEARSAQMMALKRMQGIAEEGGLTAEDEAALADIRSRNAAAERGSREAILQNAAERGVSGSGMELASQLISGQEAAGRERQAGLDVAAQARARALQAIQETGRLGGDIESRQFGEEAAKAAAQDAIEKFNVQNRNTVSASNLAARNAAAERNLNERQRIADANAALRTQQNAQSATAKQQTFQNKVAKATGQTPAYKGMAESEQTAADREKAFIGSTLGNIGTVTSAYLESKKKKPGEVV